MSITPFPIPRQVRQTDVLVGNGGAVYGPFDGFQIFDNEDIVVYVKAEAETDFVKLDVVVAKVSGLSFDFFTIGFPAPVPSTTEFVVSSERVAERSAGVKKGTLLDMTALEKELSKQASVQQETRRDIGRAIMAEFGGSPLMLAADLQDGDVLMKSGARIVKAPDYAAIVRTVESFGAVGDCTGVGLGTDDKAAFAKALAWVHGGHYRKVVTLSGKRYRISGPIISGTNPFVGAQVVMDGPITPDAGAFTAITLQNMRDCYFKLQVYEGGQDADYRQLTPAGCSEAFRIKGCRHVSGEVNANSYRGRVLLEDCVGGYFKQSFHELFIRCGDRESAFFAVPCGQAIYVRGPTTALGWYSFNSAWTKYGNVFDSIVDVAIPYAEFGALNTDAGGKLDLGVSRLRLGLDGQSPRRRRNIRPHPYEVY